MNIVCRDTIAHGCATSLSCSICWNNLRTKSNGSQYSTQSNREGRHSRSPTAGRVHSPAQVESDAASAHVNKPHVHPKHRGTTWNVLDRSAFKPQDAFVLRLHHVL